MTIYIRCKQLWQIAIAFVATSGVIFSWNSAVAQIVPDKTLGTESSVVTPNVDIKGLPSDRIDGGAIRGANLFHSFQEFGIREGRGAYFSNPAGIENIFSRVTGNNSSNINGKLGVLGNANLFLLNPNGIIFGPNASLDIGGSFVGSTANSLNFGNGQQFSATNPTAPPLLTVTVPLGVQFNQAQPSAIVNSGNLLAGTGQNLTLLGGTVVSTGQLSAPGGQVAVAAVPGGSVVKLSPSGQLLNIDTSSSVVSVGSSPLTELLRSVDEKSHPGLTVNSNGQVELTGSGLPVVDGDVVARNVTAKTATLTANHNLTLAESQLGTTGDLNLLAGDTVRVRDSVANPFVAQAGGKLLVQGRQGVDIFALNNSSSGLISGGDMVLRSLNTVGGDAHYWAGGNFRIEKLDGSLGGLFSPYDPIIRASGDVSFASYTGASLHILAGGSVTIPGTVTITGADTTNGLSKETVTLSDGKQITIDGKGSRTLDIRAGTTDFGTVGLTPNPISGIVNPSFGSVPTSANIRIGSINIQRDQGDGQVFLTNQFQPNNLQGSIEITGGINIGKSFISVLAFGDPVTIDAKGGVTIGNIITGIGSGIGGDVKILGERNITTAGIVSLIDANGSGNGGDISLISRSGTINTKGKIVSSGTNGNSGNIFLKARGNITIENEVTSRILGTRQGTETAGKIEITSESGNIINLSLEAIPPTTPVLDISGPPLIQQITSSTPNGTGGNIKLNAPQGSITTTGWTISAKSDKGVAGNVTLTAGRDIRSGNIEASSNSSSGDQKALSTITLNSSAGSVFIDGVKLSTTNTGTDYAGIININGKNIQITNNSKIESRGVDGLVFIGIDVENKVTADNVTIKNSTIDAIRNVESDLKPIKKDDGIQIASNGGIQIEGSNLSTTLKTTKSKLRSSGSITLDAKGSVSLSNGAQLRVNTAGQGDAGKISIKAEQLSLRENSGLIGDVDPNGNGNGASVNLDVTGEILLEGDKDGGFSGTGESTRITVGILAEKEQQGEGKGGEIKINAGSLVLKNGAIIKNSTQGKGDAGPISVDATKEVNISGSVAGSGFPSGFFTSTSTDGKAGDITVKTGKFTIACGAALSARTTGNGQGGTITVNANSFEAIDGGQLVTTTSGSGQAGSIIVNATDQVTISGNDPNYSDRIAKFPKVIDKRVANDIKEGSASGLFANTTENSTGKGGDISISIPTGSLFVTNGAQLRAFTNGKGDAGNITINAGDTVTFDNAFAFATVEESGIGKGGDISISIPTGSLFISNGAQLQALTRGRGNAGNVIINAGDTVSFDRGYAITKVEGNVQTQDGQKRQGGDITITTGSLSVTNGAQLQALTQGRGNAGNITIKARDISFVGTSGNGLFPSAALVEVDKNAVGNAGNIDITTDSLSITNGARLFADTQGQGNAGIIQINATGSVKISGSNSINGRPSGLFTSTNPKSTGAGGDITIGNIIKPNLFHISDGAVLSASTSNNDKAGNITVNANRFEAINGGQLITTTSSTGAAGTITVNAGRRVTISGRDATFAERRSKLTLRNLPVENLPVNSESEVFSGFFVRSGGSGQAGNIEINSPIVLLDNQGRLDANSNSQPGGNITLNKGNLLLLRRNSLITTSAGAGNGGNIEIKYPKGFIIAGFGRNNDIVANAFTGAGGKVTIKALGTVNIRALKKDELERQLRLSSNTSPEKLDPQELPTNDITAISQARGPDLQGTVNLNAPDVEPTRGTIQLPEDLGDSSKLIANSCPVGVQSAASRFVVTGRGGLPPNPGSVLSTDTFLGSAANAPSGKNATASTSIPPQEAQGVEIGPRGEIILTARPSTLTPHTPWQRLTGCYGK
ncbi:filamentous hemagglutinin N-terminal domain-containing protein [Brasilonema bromeliae]|uniref:Filamentous haemagglutinin FhaB/tRNA nuclease CdiA-like TPS domain-containing protein n=1 Tax=Brasilonema bromeliae SPC951 TaxID=385972 RepID=A0ABX1P6J0_9CYAN|nr:filamentous hemagglutinin N-terminal domain-containing protein [Brasilonema bromeliae]NMG19971.1 hypothetical protein [Brasilonema bromeliae SPC951]